MRRPFGAVVFILAYKKHLFCYNFEFPMVVVTFGDAIQTALGAPLSPLGGHASEGFTTMPCR